jgi:hypothetical protein
MTDDVRLMVPQVMQTLDKSVIHPAANEVREFSNEFAVYGVNVFAGLSPQAAQKPLAVHVPRGWGIYFGKAVNNGWTDNRDAAQSRPLEGFEFSNENEYIRPARRACLVAIATSEVFIPYNKLADRSLGNMSYYPNNTQQDWHLLWYMNDDLGRYNDNSGTANMDFVVFRI